MQNAPFTGLLSQTHSSQTLFHSLRLTDSGHVTLDEMPVSTSSQQSAQARGDIHRYRKGTSTDIVTGKVRVTQLATNWLVTYSYNYRT